MVIQPTSDGTSTFTGIQNRAIDKAFGTGNGDVALGILIGRLFRALILAGALALLLFIAMGGILWITAGGDEKKIEEARSRIMNGIIGMAVLIATVAIAIFLKPVFGIDLLNPTL